MSVNAVSLECGSCCAVHFDKRSGVGRHCADIGLPRYDGVTLPEHYRVRRRDSGQKSLSFRLQGLVGQFHGFMGGFHLSLALDQANDGLTDFQTDLLTQLLQADLELPLLEPRAEIVCLGRTIP